MLERQVLGYDEVAKRLNEKLLLVNVARVANGESVHFTTTSSIAATFDWTTTVGIAGQINQGAGTNVLNLNLGGSSAENPTFSILPVSGEEFTKRIVTPFADDSFHLLVFQGGRIDQVMRLMAGGIEVQQPDGAFVRFIENDPRRPQEYQEFRQLTMHLQWLNNQRQLFVQPLVFEETLIANFTAVPRAEDINHGFDKGLRWRQKPDGHFTLTRLSVGRVVVTNYDPMALTEQARFEFNERIKRLPKGFAYLEIRPEGAGGDLSIQGAIKLRSMFQILAFLANGITTAQEFPVAPDVRTGAVEAGPAETMQITVSNRLPDDGNPPGIAHAGRYYAVGNTDWDRRMFGILGILFQTTVGKVENVGIPITIAK